MKSQLAIRVDAGGKVGFGHLVRCLALAHHVQEMYGIETVFYSNPYEKLEQIFVQNGFIHVFNQNLSEAAFLKKIIAENQHQLLFIDNLFPYDDDIISTLTRHLKVILFHNFCEGVFASDYAIFPMAHLRDEVLRDKRWATKKTKLLYGFDYVLINEKVKQFVNQSNIIGSKSHIAVTTGASDPAGILIRILEWLKRNRVNIHFKLLYGFDLYNADKLNSLSGNLPDNLEVKAFNYEDLFSATLAISAFGVTPYELIYAHVPVLTIGHNPQSAQASKTLHERYHCNYDMGCINNISEEQFLNTVRYYWFHKDKRQAIQAKQFNLIDGQGLDRLGNIIFNSC